MKNQLNGSPPIFFAQEHVGFVQSGPPAEAILSQSVPKYRSELHLNQLKNENSDFGSGDLKKSSGSGYCKILLLFSEDGVGASDLAVSLAHQVEVEVRVRFNLRGCQSELEFELLGSIPNLFRTTCYCKMFSVSVHSKHEMERNWLFCPGQ